jgi:hypothetical protein
MESLLNLLDRTWSDDDEVNPVPPIMRGDGNLQQLCKINLLKLLLIPLNLELKLL